MGRKPEALGSEVRAVPYGRYEDTDFEAPKISGWSQYLADWLDSSAPVECTMEEHISTRAEF